MRHLTLRSSSFASLTGTAQKRAAHYRSRLTSQFTMTQTLTRESLAGIGEGDLVKRLLADPHWRSRLLGLHGIPTNARDYSGVLHNDLGKKGDIDILVVDPAKPQFATSVQIKRIKVTAQTFQTGKPNKLAELAKLHEQSNRLVELGFWQVYSYALVVVDSRANNRGEYRYDGLTVDLRTKINDSLTTEGLHQYGGFVHFELVQPIDHYPLGAGTFSVRLIRAATIQPQAASVTAWVSRIATELDA